jgi:hypothetical protein
MIRTVSASSVYDTTSTWPYAETPMIKNRRSDVEWSASANVVESASSNTVAASRKFDVMILEIGRRLRGIPRENHEASIASSIGNSPTLKRAFALAWGMDLDRDV